MNYITEKINNLRACGVLKVVEEDEEKKQMYWKCICLG